MNKIKIHVYPDAKHHVHDTVEHSSYVNSVPFSQIGLEKHVERVGPEEAEFFYMGQFHNEYVYGHKDHLGKFPDVIKHPSKHIADLDGDWNLEKELDPIFRRCFITTSSHDRFLFGIRSFPRPPMSALLRSLSQRNDSFPFTENRVHLGFKGSTANHWSRLSLAALLKKWGLPSCIVTSPPGASAKELESQTVKDYETFMIGHGLAMCPRGAGDCSVRFYEACYYTCVPIIIGNHGILGEDYYDTSFAWRISDKVNEQEMLDFFCRILKASFFEQRDRAHAAREYFDKVVRSYFDDPTLFYLRYLRRHSDLYNEEQKLDNL